MSRMRSLTAALLATALVACGDDGTGPGPETFAGNWTATRLEFVSTVNPAQRIEVIALGATFSLLLRSNGTWDATLTFPGEPDEDLSGTWTSTVDVFTMVETGGSNTMQFDYLLAGNTLTLTGADGEFDLNDDGVDDPVLINITLTR